MSKAPLSITGTGAVCGSGITIDAIWKSILEGKSAIGPIEQWDSNGWPVKVAAEVKGVDNRTLVEDRKLHKLISRTDLFGLYAAGSAVQQSGLNAYRESLAPDTVNRFNDRSGVYAGSGGGNYRSNHDFFPALTAANGSLPTFGREFSNSVNPMWLLKNLPNNVVCHVGIRHNFKGSNACITNQCVGGVLAVMEAAYGIRNGEADRAIAVGHDAPIEPETVINYFQLGLLAPDALRPFDAERAGTTFGEGAAAVLLETTEQARERKGRVLGEFLGAGSVTEAAGVVDVRPDGDGVSRAIELALADAGIKREEVGMVVAHGNGTKASDASEAAGLRRVFGDAIPPVTAYKWAFGHLISGSGVLDLIMALRALEEMIVPGIPLLKQPDPAFAPFPVSSSAQKPRSDVALVICRGFAAMNVALLVRRASSSPG